MGTPARIWSNASIGVPVGLAAVFSISGGIAPINTVLATRFLTLSDCFECQRDALTTPYAERDHAALNAITFHRMQGHYAEAEPLYKRGLAIREKALGPHHPSVGISLSNLAALYTSQGRYAEAEPLYKRAVTINENALASDHPNLGQTLNNLAGLYFALSDWARATDFWRRSTSIVVRHTERGSDNFGQALTGKNKGEAEQAGYSFSGLVKAAHQLAAQDRGVRNNFAREMFQAAQWARTSEAAASLAQMAARSAKGDPKLAALVRERH
jgi:tetratricopeptide (TPR) repeat protein